MGYDIHVTRAKHWTESSDLPISLEEWLAFVVSDPELRLDGFATAANSDGEVIRYESPGLAVWTAWSRHGADGNMAWIDHRDGELVVKNPDDEILQKLLQVATALDARVQGDDGEEYGRWTRQVDRPVPLQRKPWWRRFFGGAS